MSKVRIIGARLSSNPETAVIQHEQGINGVVNTTTNGKLFYVVDALVMKGTLPIVKSQMFWADNNGRFALSAGDYNKFNAGKEIDGGLVRFEDVPPYQVDGKTYTHVELLVFEGQENAQVVGAYIKRQQQASANTAGGGILNTNVKPTAAGETPKFQTSEAPVPEEAEIVG